MSGILFANNMGDLNNAPGYVEKTKGSPKGSYLKNRELGQWLQEYLQRGIVKWGLKLRGVIYGKRISA